MQAAQYAGANGGDVPPLTRPLIARLINTREDGMRSFDVRETYSARSYLKHTMGLTLDQLSFGKPVLLPGANGSESSRFLVGSDDPTGASSTATKNFVACLSLDTRSDQPIHAIVETEEHVRDISLISADTAILALGNGSLQICHVSNHGSDLGLDASCLVHTDENNAPVLVSEVTVSPFSSNKVASCALDKHVAALDITNGLSPSSVKVRQHMGDSVASVRWDDHRNHLLHTIWGTDQPSSLMILDERVGFAPTQAAYNYHSGRNYMYAMRQYREYGVLLGFEDGEIRHVDLRMSNAITALGRDPFCCAIGSIDFSPSGKVFTCSGLTDFSIWHIDDDGNAEIVGHSEATMNRRTNVNGYVMNAIFAADNQILASDSFGSISTFTSHE